MVIDTTLLSDNPLRLRKNILKQKYNKIMIIDDQIEDEKLQYNINKEAGDKILPYNQVQIIEQAKFTYSPLGKEFGT